MIVNQTIDCVYETIPWRYGPYSIRDAVRLLISAARACDAAGGGAAGCDYVNTEAWVSMGELEAACKQRIEQPQPYPVNRELLAMTENPALNFMH